MNKEITQEQLLQAYTDECARLGDITLQKEKLLNAETSVRQNINQINIQLDNMIAEKEKAAEIPQ